MLDRALKGMGFGVSDMIPGTNVYKNSNILLMVQIHSKTIKQ